MLHRCNSYRNIVAIWQRILLLPLIWMSGIGVLRRQLMYRQDCFHFSGNPGCPRYSPGCALVITADAELDHGPRLFGLSLQSGYERPLRRGARAPWRVKLKTGLARTHRARQCRFLDPSGTSRNDACTAALPDQLPAIARHRLLGKSTRLIWPLRARSFVVRSDPGRSPHFDVSWILQRSTCILAVMSGTSSSTRNFRYSPVFWFAGTIRG